MMENWWKYKIYSFKNEWYFINCFQIYLDCRISRRILWRLVTCFISFVIAQVCLVYRLSPVWSFSPLLVSNSALFPTVLYFRFSAFVLIKLWFKTVLLNNLFQYIFFSWNPLSLGKWQSFFKNWFHSTKLFRNFSRLKRDTRHLF